MTFAGAKLKLMATLVVLAVGGGGLFLLINEAGKSRQREVRSETAMKHFRRGEYEKCIPAFKEIYRESPKSQAGLQALYCLAMCYTELEKHQIAEAYWEELRRKDLRGRFGDVVLFYQGLIAEKTGDVEQARDLYNDLLGRFRDSTVADRTLLQLAGIYEKQGNLPKARNTLKEIIEMFPNSEKIGEVQDALGDVNVRLAFSPEAVPGQSIFYQVDSGDTLNGIASGFGTTVELLRISNGIKKDLIHPGQKLKVMNGKFSLVADKSSNTMILKLNGEFFKLYRVGSGRDNSTPVGNFKVVNKLKEPPWHHKGKTIPFGDPENILGTRWMGIDRSGYGIHGTWDPDSIGKQSSAGCIRLRNEEVEELYDLVPVGTPVTVVD